jgi:hypothetical protein
LHIDYGYFAIVWDSAKLADRPASLLSAPAMSASGFTGVIQTLAQTRSLGRRIDHREDGLGHVSAPNSR